MTRACLAWQLLEEEISFLQQQQQQEQSSGHGTEQEGALVVAEGPGSIGACVPPYHLLIMEGG